MLKFTISKVLLWTFVFIILFCRGKRNWSVARANPIEAEKTCDTQDDITSEYRQHPSFDTNPFRRSRQSTFSSECMKSYWIEKAQHTLREQLRKQSNGKVAKNVIFFLGDGMSIPTITASRIYAGQLKGHRGEEGHLSFEKFPYVGLAKTYCVDKQVPDSACTATAYLCGVKANYYTIGVTPKVVLNDCIAANKTSNHVESLAAWAQKVGKATGVITTATVTHASPAGLYANVANRGFECDADIKNLLPNDPECKYDIAQQLIRDMPGRKFNVIFGGGRKKFLPRNEVDEQGHFGQRNDFMNLINFWKKTHPNGKYVYDKNGLLNLDWNSSEDVLGLFASDHMSYNLDADREKEPTLQEMTIAAIMKLQNNKNGYFLFVEGARIDHGHHGARAHKALDETVQFSEAIQSAMDMTDDDDTLLVVTSDHSHTMSMAGYPNRGNNILGLNTVNSDIDKLPYTTLAYANGPGHKHHFGHKQLRKDLSDAEFHKNFEYPGIVPTAAETHGGDDVAVFAKGPMAHLFSGVYEQHTIPHLVGYAACMGEGQTICKDHPN